MPDEPTRTSRRTTLWAVLLAVLVGALLGASAVALAGNRGSPAGSANQAMCLAADVANTALPSVVTIAASNGTHSGSGSGSIIQNGGYILTNDHVISVAGNGGKVSVPYADGKTSDAEIVGRDPSTDVAVIKAADDASGYPVITTASSADLVVGQPVVALGAPLGLTSTVTSGIVSALDRYVPVPKEPGVTAHLIGAIQTDAAINPGNSGGALRRACSSCTSNQAGPPTPRACALATSSRRSMVNPSPAASRSRWRPSP